MSIYNIVLTENDFDKIDQFYGRLRVIVVIVLIGVFLGIITFTEYANNDWGEITIAASVE